MQTYPECIPCITKLLQTTLRVVDLKEIEQERISAQILEDLSKADKSLPPACLAGESYRKILAKTSQEDIFQTHKANSINEAQKLYSRLKKLVNQADDKLDTAIKISALGNILDIANPNGYNLVNEIDTLMEYQIQGDSLETFRKSLKTASNLLILADNAGETVFDKVLIETLDIPVIYSVKGGPAFDDALHVDALLAGIDQVATLISSGTPYPGTYLPSCSPEFNELFNNADLILSKGQANNETLNEVDRELFFLLKVKCEVVSREIGFPIGNLVLKHHTA